MATALRCVAAWGAVTALLGCGRPAQVRYQQQLERTPPAAVHAVHGERLAELMRGLERLRTERLPQAMDVELASELRVEEIESVARSIARSAGEISAAAEGLDLSDADRREFTANADRLRERAARLGEGRPGLDLAALRADVAAVEDACRSCHQEFRPIRGGAGGGP